MLRGISSCVCGTRIATKRRFSGPHHHRPWTFYAVVWKGFSSAGIDVGDISERAAERGIDQSFTASHSGPDGRKFQFATVVVKAMKKGESPLRIWEQSCALIGGNSPTLAVAFVSKPTESALRTVQVLAGQLSAGAKSESKQPPPSPSPSPCPQLHSEISLADTTGLLEQTLSSETAATSSRHPPRASSLSTPLTSSQPSLSSGSLGAIEGGQTLSPPEALNGAEHVPLIGCIMEDLGGEFEGSDDAGSITSTFRVNSRGSSPDILQFGSTADSGFDGGFRLRSSVPRPLEFDPIQGEDVDDEEEGTLSDWENLFSEYAEEAFKVLDSKADREGDQEEDWKDGPAEQISKEGLVSFLNALVKHRNPGEESGGGGDLRALERREQNREVVEDMGIDREVMSRAAAGDVLVPELERSFNGTGLGFQPRQTWRVFGDVEGTITVEPRNGGDKAGISDSDLGKEEVSYKLVLCVGHMPGTKAVSFHSSTTGIPRLPDLENAVTESNPHMLLIGAPGFVFPEFIRRLAAVFPSSCRAGAFLSPLFTSKQNKWARAAEETKSGPLFFGTQISTSGVAGLAISSEVKGSEVPVGAFAEFARMSVGMPRIRGYIFLDEAISKKLFLPKNVSLQNISGSSKGSSTAPSSVLDQLSKRLLKKCAVPLHPTKMAAERPSDPANELIVVDGSSPHSAKEFLSSSPAEEELQTLDRLPLALLDSVLFPGWSMPFYIYEPCYRVMVRRCLELGKPFGLSLCSGSWGAEAVASGEVIGTIANLKVHSFERDCRSYIIAHGVRRFRVLNERVWTEPGTFGLTMGQVQFFDDKECEGAEEKQELLELAKRAVTLCCQVMSEAQSAPGLVKSTHDPQLASFAVGHVLDVPTRVKRRWLKMVDTKTRLLEQITFLETKIPTSP